MLTRHSLPDFPLFWGPLSTYAIPNAAYKILARILLYIKNVLI